MSTAGLSIGGAGLAVACCDLGGGALSSINGDIGPDVLLDAGDIPSTGPSTVQADIDLLKPVTSQAELEALYPNVAGVHTIDAPTRFDPPVGGANIVLDTGRNIVVVFPGSLVSSGGIITTLEGNTPGPLVSGECPIANLRIKNNGGSDVRIDSLAGRNIILENVELVGDDPGVIENIYGAMAFNIPVIQAPTINSVGLKIDGIIGAMAFYGGGAFAFGTNPYIGFRVLSTCTIVVIIAWINVFGLTVTAADGLFYIDPGATMPVGELGIRVTDSLIEGPGQLFAAGSIGPDDPSVFSGGNINGESSRYLGDLIQDVGTGAAANLVHMGFGGTLQVAPPQNPGPTSILALQDVSERHSFSITSAVAPYRWSMSYVGLIDRLAGSAEWSAEVARDGGGTPSLEGFIQIKRASASGSTALLVPDLGVAGAAPDDTYTITINGVPFDEVSVSQTKAQVVTNLRATIDAGAEPVITAQSDAPEAFEIVTTAGATFIYSSSPAFDVWETPQESKGVISLTAARSNVGGKVRHKINTEDEYRIAFRSDTPGTDTDIFQLKLVNEGTPP